MHETSEPSEGPVVELASDGDLARAIGPTLEDLFHGRVQQKVDLGRGAAGFEAIDQAENLTLITIKAGTADEGTVAEVQERLQRYHQYRGPQVRALLIAKDFTQGALNALQTSNGLDLQSYQVNLFLSAPRLVT